MNFHFTGKEKPEEYHTCSRFFLLSFVEAVVKSTLIETYSRRECRIFPRKCFPRVYSLNPTLSGVVLCFPACE